MSIIFIRSPLCCFLMICLMHLKDYFVFSLGLIFLMSFQVVGACLALDIIT